MRLPLFPCRTVSTEEAGALQEALLEGSAAPDVEAGKPARKHSWVQLLGIALTYM